MHVYWSLYLDMCPNQTINAPSQIYPNAVRLCKWYQKPLHNPQCICLPVATPKIHHASTACLASVSAVGASIFRSPDCDPSTMPAAALSAFLFKKLRYVCHPIAMTPAKILLYCGSMNVKLNAVTTGHNLQLFTTDVGTVCFMRSQIAGRESPDRNDCMPKKYVLNEGANTI